MKFRFALTLCAFLIGAAPAHAQDKIKFKVMGQPLSGGAIQKNKEAPFFETLAAKSGLPIEIDYKAGYDWHQGYRAAAHSGVWPVRHRLPAHGADFTG